MPTPTPELGLQQAIDSDDTANYLDTQLANSLTTIDSLFNNTTGHTHGGVHQGGPIGTIPASAIPDGSVNSAKIVDGSIQTVDLGDGIVTTAKLAANSVTSANIVDGTIQDADIAAGTITSDKIATFANGPKTSDWFRNETTGLGLYNDASGQGIGLPAGGATLYPSGDPIVGLNSTQTLANKTINGPTLGGTVSGTPTWASPQSFPAGERVGGALSVANANSGSTDWKLFAGNVFVGSGPGNGQVGQTAVSFSGFTVAPTSVVATIVGVSGGPATPGIYVTQITSITAAGCTISVYNGSGGGQSYGLHFMAFGH